MMASYNNPFRPGPGSDPPYLAGRDNEQEEFVSILYDTKMDSQLKNLLIYGIRGIGKTVLLNRFEQICLNEGFLPVKRLQYSEKHSDPKIFASIFERDLNGAIEKFSRQEKIKGKLRSTAEYIKPTSLGVPNIVSYEPAYSSNSKLLLEDYLEEYLIKKWNIIKENNYEGVVFLFDEFHMINNIKSDRWFVLTDLISAINEVQKTDCKYLLVLCGLPTLPTNIKNARSYSERMFGVMEVSNLNEIDARKAILEPLKKTNWDFSKELVSSIIDDVDGYPYFIQFFSNKIIKQIKKNDIDIDDYNRMKKDIIKQLEHEFFNPRMEQLSDKEKNILNLISTIPDTKMSFSSIHQISHLQKGHISNILNRLEEKGLIFRSKRGVYQFSIPLLRKILSNKMS